MHRGSSTRRRRRRRRPPTMSTIRSGHRQTTRTSRRIYKAPRSQMVEVSCTQMPPERTLARHRTAVTIRMFSHLYHHDHPKTCPPPRPSCGCLSDARRVPSRWRRGLRVRQKMIYRRQVCHRVHHSCPGQARVAQCLPIQMERPRRAGWAHHRPDQQSSQPTQTRAMHSQHVLYLMIRKAHTLVQNPPLLYQNSLSAPPYLHGQSRATKQTCLSPRTTAVVPIPPLR